MFKQSFFLVLALVSLVVVGSFVLSQLYLIGQVHSPTGWVDKCGMQRLDSKAKAKYSLASSETKIWEAECDSSFSTTAVLRPHPWSLILRSEDREEVCKAIKLSSLRWQVEGNTLHHHLWRLRNLRTRGGTLPD